MSGLTFFMDLKGVGLRHGVLLIEYPSIISELDFFFFARLNELSFRYRGGVVEIVYMVLIVTFSYIGIGFLFWARG